MAWLYLLIVLLAAAPAAVLGAGQPPPQAAQDEFVPLETLPPDEQLPAAPLVLAAYAAAWVVVFIYLWSIWQRLGRVERDIAVVARRVERDAVTGPKPGSGGGQH